MSGLHELHTFFLKMICLAAATGSLRSAASKGLPFACSALSRSWASGAYFIREFYVLSDYPDDFFGFYSNGNGLSKSIFFSCIFHQFFKFFFFIFLFGEWNKYYINSQALQEGFSYALLFSF